jgi:hypothetical protein
MSDWANPQKFSGETAVVAMGYRDSSGGSKVAPPVDVYGYTFALNPNNVVQSIKLPNNSSVQVLAITLSNYTAALPESPAITVEPVDLTVTNANSAVFTVSATGTPPLSYQWQFDGTNLTDGGNVAGSSSDTLTLSSVSATNAGTYDVIVSNPYGHVTSSDAVLDVTNAAFMFEAAAEAVDGSVTFSWQTTPGLPYQVQYTTNLADPTWVNLGAAIVASNGVTSASDTNAIDPERFYRIIQQ